MGLTPNKRLKEIAEFHGATLADYRAALSLDGAVLFTEKVKACKYKLVLSYSGAGDLVAIQLRLPRLAEDQVIPL